LITYYKRLITLGTAPALLSLSMGIACDVTFYSMPWGLRAVYLVCHRGCTSYEVIWLIPAAAAATAAAPKPSSLFWVTERYYGSMFY